MTELKVMNWYLLSKIANELPQQSPEVLEAPPLAPPPISREEFEEMMQRGYNIGRTYNDHEIESDDGKPSRKLWNWKDWHQHYGDDHVGMMLENESSLHNRYFQHWPEGYTVYDALRDYREGKLPSKINPSYNHQKSTEIEPTDVGPRNLPWQSQKPTIVSPEAAKQIWQMATARTSKTNKKEVERARRALFLAFNSDKSLASKIGIPQSSLNQKIKSYGNFNVAAQRMEHSLNHNIPEEHSWVGISNASYLGRMAIQPDELEQFVKSIKVPGDGRSSYSGNRGELLRRYIAASFLGIDTRISYKDLSFEIGSTTVRPGGRPALGQYSANQKLITISDINANTVAHEIGHYLDDKWGREYAHSQEYPSYLSDTAHHMKNNIPPAHLAWLQRYTAFVGHLTDMGNIASAYYQEPKETFARFIDYFVTWTSKQAGAWGFSNDHTIGDRFSQQDCTAFVRLLQEKSFIDSRYPLSQKS